MSEVDVTGHTVLSLSDTSDKCTIKSFPLFRFASLSLTSKRTSKGLIDTLSLIVVTCTFFWS